MYRILMVEDDAGIVDAVRSHAAKWELKIEGCQDFNAVTAEFERMQPHLVILDIHLPYFDGYHWCRELRKISTVPVLFLSAISDNLNQVMAMSLGADDFIAKPFDADVLVAKLLAMLRRTYDLDQALPVLECRGAILSPSAGTLTFDEKRLALTKNETKLLTTLFTHRGENVSREKLMDALWDSDQYIDDNTLTVNINRLRKKLESIGLADFILTCHGVGYRIEV